MIHKIKQIIREQINLIQPLIKTGTTQNIRTYAQNDYNNLVNIVSSKLSEEVFIKKYKTTIISCCMSIYNKLSDDSRYLPTVTLRELAKSEAEDVISIWSIVEKNY